MNKSKIYAAIAMANGKRTSPFVHIVIDKITKIINMILLKKDKKFPIVLSIPGDSEPPFRRHCTAVPF